MVDEKETKEQEGYYLQEVTTATGTALMKDGKQISDAALLVKMANALEEAGILK